jgi:hypothetical protein
MLARLVVLFAAIGAGAIGIVRGTWAVGGSDSSCYALMADAFADGRLQPSTPLATEAPWPDAPRTFALAGFIPSPVERAAASPICSPGFSVLLAPLRVIGGRDAIFLLTPIAGALLVWCTFVLGREISTPVAGAAAAVIVATTPVFLFQLVQPMNDVTVAAIWTAIAVVAVRFPTRAWALGALCGLAILVRPNLVPSVAPVFVWAVAAPAKWRGGARFLAAFWPFLALTLALNDALYGGAFATGYGASGDLFSAAHLLPNVTHYGGALFATQLGFPLVGCAAPFVLPRAHRRVAWLILLVTGTVALVYLPYTPFPEWWYLRFFLPVLPMLTVLATATLAAIARQQAVVVATAAALVLFTVTTSASRAAFDLHRLEGRFRISGDVMRARLPPNSIFITIWESGTARYHADRDAMLWDSLDPQWLDRAVSWLEHRGLHPIIVVEEWEEPAFRTRFASSSTLGDLDWPPRFDVARQVRFFDPADRARYLAGEALHTEIVRPNRR